VRFRSATFAVPLALALAAVGAASAQDFDPNGRHHAPHPPAHPPPHGPVPHGPATPAPGTSPAALLDRYTRIVIAQPGAPFPLQRLAQLYRDRDGALTALVADLTARAAQPGADQYAATVALAGVAKLDGRPDDAVRIYQAAITLSPRGTAAILALAHLLQDRGDVLAARGQFERALALKGVATERSETLHALLTLALDAKDFEGARRYHVDLVHLEPNSRFVQGELGRELYARGEYERAVVELKVAVKAAAGDNRTLAPALKDLGQAEAKAHQNPEALATLERGLAVAGPLAAVRSEIYQTITEIYRSDQQLPVFIKKLEDQHPVDYTRLALLGSLYEETGDAPHALGAYKRALAIEPRQIDLRLKMIRLLQAEGELEPAILAYEGLVRAAPNNPQFVFEMCDALIQRGDRTRALRLLTELEARDGSDEEVMSRLGEFYTRIGEPDRSVRILSRLAQLGGSDPSHLADLGDHYFQEGNQALAVTTWKRMLTTVTPRARALAALGGVYVEHDMLPDAVVVLREAADLEPQNLSYKKDLASALERSKAYREAGVLWEALADKAKERNDRVLAREVRTHVVTLWALEHTIERQVPRLEAAFNADPPDVEAGRTLAEVLLHTRRLPETETALRRVTVLAPGDADSYLALERVLVQEGKLDDAIAVLAKLVQVDPKRARETYQRMAQYALQLYKDQDAIKYAARAVELNPDDAEGHRRLGDMYRSRQDSEHAIVEYRAAIAKNDRLYLVYFELADLLLSKGETDEADRLFRRVLRGAPDEELVTRAARMSMQINLGKGTLSSLEQDLVPLAIGNPQKVIYRHLLVEMYGNLTFGLVQRVRHGTGKDAEDARAALARVGQRAVKPLLDALADGDGGQQRIAIDVLGYVANKNAGPTLFGFALGNAETALRIRAMIACGALADPSLLGRYDAYLLPKGRGGAEVTPTDAVAVAATWGVARMKDARALPLLRALAKSGTPEVRALAVLGLGAQGDRAAAPEVLSLVREVDAGDVARAAAAYTLGELGVQAATPLLVTLAEDGDPLPRQMALLSLARLANGQPAKETAVLAAMADAVFAGGDPGSARARAVSDSLRRTGAAALTMMAGGGGEPAKLAHVAGEQFPVPDSSVQVEPMLTALVPTGFSAKDRAAVIVSYPEVLLRAAETALETSGDRAGTVLSAIAEGNGSFEPFLGPVESPDTAAARIRARALVAALEPSILVLVRHPDVQLRIQALGLLASSETDAATSALVEAVSDANDAVVRVALAALGTHPSGSTPHALTAATHILERQADWSLRVLAAEALGRLGSLDPSAKPAKDDAAHVLAQAAVHDTYALVREASLRALARFDSAAAITVARTLEVDDPEPRVQEVARALVHPAPGSAHEPSVAHP
jgi:tetratricopeptide (TPR) repeat protein/HEAT repeat protein